MKMITIQSKSVIQGYFFNIEREKERRKEGDKKDTCISYQSLRVQSNFIDLPPRKAFLILYIAMASLFHPHPQVYESVFHILYYTIPSFEPHPKLTKTTLYMVIRE
jgi:hypothetical protein